MYVVSFGFLILLLLLGVRYLLLFIYKPILYNGEQLNFTTTSLSETQENGKYNTLTVMYGNGFSKERISAPKIDLLYGDNVRISGKV